MQVRIIQPAIFRADEVEAVVCLGEYNDEQCKITVTVKFKTNVYGSETESGVLI